MSNSYKVYCFMDGWVYTKSDDPPTECPHNQYHYIDTNLTEQVSCSSMVNIQENPGFTYHHPVNEGLTFTVNTNSTNSGDFIIPLDISIVKFTFMTVPNQEDDVINAFVHIAEPLGTLTRDHVIGETTIDITTPTQDFIHPGYNLILNGENLGRILTRDAKTGAIQFTVENALASNVSSGTPFYVNVYFVRNFIIGGPGPYYIGSALTNSALKKNRPITFEYTNNSSVDVKNPKFTIEYLY